ncbi:hypothetical protein [Salinivibrio sp. ML290]|uniref:hypothetical protein n=1 Tax=Salinivibrio sp. ML290 TaxID=1909468 RepID=UPI0009889501|nr:hypothetical protein [Salinivibrio sp. ML290]OOE74620.1 hypothetical protein BZG23_08290 [Salinivibrio sp. ML290]
MLIIYTILLIVMSVTLFSWLYDNSARKKERDESILKFREQVEKYSTLSDNDLIKMRKIYRRRFSEKSVYHYQGKYNSVWLSPGFQNRWFDHCIDNIRVESIFWPPKIYSEQESHIKVKGLIYKDALFATHINDIDLIHERLKSEQLPKEWVMRPVDKVYLEAFLFLPLPISIFSLIMSTANFPLGLSITLIFLLIVVGLIAFAIIRMHRLMKIEGECKLPQRKEEFDSYKVIDSILVRDPQKNYPLASHIYYTALKQMV